VASGENGERLAGRNWKRSVTYFNHSNTYDLNLDDKKKLDRILDSGIIRVMETLPRVQSKKVSRKNCIPNADSIWDFPLVGTILTGFFIDKL